MKILYIFNRGEIGGATKAMLNSIVGLNQEEFEPIIISPNKTGFVSNFCKSNNLKFIYIKYFELGYAFNEFNFKKLVKFLLLPLLFILNKLFNYVSYKKLTKLIDLDSVDCIHTNTNRDDFGIFISKKKNIKHILHLREFDKDFFNIKYLKRNVYKYFDCNTDCFIAVSEAVKDYYSNKGISKDKIRVIYDGIDIDKILKKDTLNDNKYRIVMLSNIAENKGQIQLIEAINMMPTEVKNKISVDFYGTGSTNYISFLKKIVEKYSLNNQIIFKGYQQNVYEVLKDYDIGVTLSKVEGFGLVTVEYMAAGLCTIVSDTGANKEIINDKIDGLIYRYNDYNDLKEKILQVVNNPLFANKIVQNAQIKIKNFSKEENVNNIQKTYKEII